jgi:hypothetical protein
VTIVITTTTDGSNPTGVCKNLFSLFHYSYQYHI